MDLRELEETLSRVWLGTHHPSWFWRPWNHDGIHAFAVSYDEVHDGFANNLELQLCFQFRSPYVTVLIRLPLFLAEEGSKVVKIPQKMEPPKSGESDSFMKVQLADAIISMQELQCLIFGFYVCKYVCVFFNRKNWIQLKRPKTWGLALLLEEYVTGGWPYIWRHAEPGDVSTKSFPSHCGNF